MTNKTNNFLISYNNTKQPVNCWDIRNAFVISFFPYIIQCWDIRKVEILGMLRYLKSWDIRIVVVRSLYHSFPFLEWWLPSIYTLYMNEWIKKLPFINLKMVSEPWNWNPGYFVAMVVRQRSTILRQTLILISQPSNALTTIRLIPPVWISHNFKATTLGMIKKKWGTEGLNHGPLDDV